MYFGMYAICEGWTELHHPLQVMEISIAVVDRYFCLLIYESCFVCRFLSFESKYCDGGYSNGPSVPDCDEYPAWHCESRRRARQLPTNRCDTPPYPNIPARQPFDEVCEVRSRLRILLHGIGQRRPMRGDSVRLHRGVEANWHRQKVESCRCTSLGSCLAGLQATQRRERRSEAPPYGLQGSWRMHRPEDSKQR